MGRGWVYKPSPNQTTSAVWGRSTRARGKRGIQTQGRGLGLGQPKRSGPVSSCFLGEGNESNASLLLPHPVYPSTLAMGRCLTLECPMAWKSHLLMNHCLAC